MLSEQTQKCTYIAWRVLKCIIFRTPCALFLTFYYFPENFRNLTIKPLSGFLPHLAIHCILHFFFSTACQYCINIIIRNFNNQMDLQCMLITISKHMLHISINSTSISSLENQQSNGSVEQAYAEHHNL